MQYIVRMFSINANNIMTIDEQFNTVFTRHDIGKQLCREGVPHSDKWHEEVTAGYAEEYEKQAIEDAKCQNQA
jgi:hypothetical protein